MTVYDGSSLRDKYTLLTEEVANGGGLGNSGGGGGGGGTVDQVARDAATANAAAIAANVSAITLNTDFITDFKATEPYQQTLKDSGRMVAEEEQGSVSTGAAFDGTSMEVSTSRAIEVSSHKFIHNNTTHGGNQGPIDPIVDDLLIAMGRNVGTRSRYGTEFYVAKRRVLDTPNAASKRTVGGVDYFLCNAGIGLLGVDAAGTAAFWTWSENDDDTLVYVANRADNPLWIDGVLDLTTNANTILTAGWHHICYQMAADTGYASAQPRMYGKASVDFANSLPIFTGGRTHILPHVAPAIYR